MQSDDSFSRIRQHSDLRPPFEYQPQTAPRPRGSSTSSFSLPDDVAHVDPDDYYRTFAEQSPRSIIAPVYDLGTMATPRTRKGSFAVTDKSPRSSPLSKKHDSPSSIPTPVSAPRRPPIVTQTSVKEKVKALDRNNVQGQVQPGHPAPASRRASSSIPRSPRRSEVKLQTQKNDSQVRQVSGQLGRSRISTDHRGRAESAPRQQPLFGEILVENGVDAEAGFGIAAVKQPHKVRKVKSHSHHGSQSQVGMSAGMSSNPTSSARAASLSKDAQSDVRRRSRDDFKSDSPVGFSSRIPVRSHRVSDASSRRSSTPENVRPGAEEEGSNAGPAYRRTPVKSRRYSPKRLAEPSQTLSAVVKALPPKESPALRSSRPRQPVAVASTSASRARTSERLAQVRSAPGNVILPLGSRIESTIAGAETGIIAPTSGCSSDNEEEETFHDTDENPVQSSSRMDEAVTYYLEPTVFRFAAKQEPKSAEIAHDEDRTGHTIDLTPHGTPSHEECKSAALHYQSNRDTVEMATSGDSASSGNIEPHLLAHILGMRQTLPMDTPRTQAVSDFLSEKDDAETIQIILGATPILPSIGWAEQSFNESDDGNASPAGSRSRESTAFDSGLFGARSSIRPDDSVSVVYGRNRHHVPTQHALLPGGLTLNSEDRSEVNRLLDTYRENKGTSEARSSRQSLEPRQSSTSSQVGLTDPQTGPQAIYDQTLNETFDSQNDHQRTSLDLAVHTSVDASQPLNTPAIFAQSISFRADSGSADRSENQIHSHTSSSITVRPNQPVHANQGAWFVQPEVAPLVPPKDIPLLSKSSPRLHNSSNAQHSHGGIDRTASGTRHQLSMSKTTEPYLHQPDQDAPSKLENMVAAPVLEAFPSAEITDNFLLEATNFYTLNSEPPTTRHTRAPSSKNNETSYRPSVTSRKDLRQSRPGSTDGRNNDYRGVDLSPVLPSTPRDQEKELNERRNCIKELVDTEHSYSQDLIIMEDIYMGTSSAVLGDDDRRILFGNISAVRAFSFEFFDALRQSASAVYTIPRENRWNYKRGSHGTSYSGNTENSSSTASVPSDKERLASDGKTTIGQVFLANMARIEKVYGDWIVKTNDAANTRLKELQRSTTVNMWLEECFASAKDLTSAWSLDALIIKPAQRLMKYPLLLGALVKCTSRDHPDYEALKQANDAIMTVTSRINEAKKRAELVDQAMNRKRKDSESKMRVGKLLNRKTEKLKQQVGLSSIADDQGYEAVAQKFGGHFFQLQVVMRDVEKYLEDTQTSISWLNVFLRALVNYTQIDGQERWPEVESDWVKFAHVVQVISDIDLQEHLSEVRRHVIDPILTLWKLHDGPQKIMQKRKKRLMDHIRYKTAVARGEKPDRKLQNEEDEYNAVNEILKEELPKLYALTKRLVEACLMNFVDLQVQWQSVLKRRLEGPADSSHEMPDMDSFIAKLQSINTEDSDLWDLKLRVLGICNGTTLAEAQSMHSASSLLTQDDGNSSQRPSTMGSSRRALSINGDQSSTGTPILSRNAESFNLSITSPLLGGFGLPDGIVQSSSSRTRASSAISSRGPSTPQTFSTQNHLSMSIGGRPSTVADGSQDSQHALLRLDSESGSGSQHGKDAFSPASKARLSDYAQQHSQSRPAEARSSLVFQSALPATDSSRAPSPHPSEQIDDAKVLFLAASLFEFNIDGSRREAGFPYLRYVPGEIFDVIGQKGELWLARNQDDADGLVGWIWEKHFARILPDDP